MKIAVLYLVFGLLWIFFSDPLVSALVSDPALQLRINIFKGVFFVITSAFIIYLLSASVFAKLSDNEQVILENRNELKVMLYYDHLTGLFNRRKLIDRLPEYLKNEPEKGKALLYLDIDNIKLINDTMGHTFGDALIASTSRRIASILMPPDELYRLGGDEFIILTKYAQITDVQKKADSVLALFNDPVPIEGTLLHSTVSMGIALYPLHCEDPGELLKFADIAMYQSKKNGKKQAVLYNTNMMSAINERMSLGEYLHDALTKNELEVFFQPQLDIGTKKITSFEALLRWNNHILGKVAPDKFISVAEETHLIIPIGEWILRESCLFIRKLHQEGFPALTISVNISMIQLLQENFVSKVFSVLEETGLEPAKLELEITESILMESWSVIKSRLEQLRARGIGIALDDFGKGYSSLSYLERLPITVLKIDKIFIDGIQDDDKDSSLTGNIVQIAKKLGLTVIAEGVETEIQFAYLEAQHCDRIQGWLFSKALCMTDAEDIVRLNLG
jgi:diguanylate cyclase (GGDEF)-like protein